MSYINITVIANCKKKIVSGHGSHLSDCRIMCFDRSLYSTGLLRGNCSRLLFSQGMSSDEIWIVAVSIPITISSRTRTGKILLHDTFLA